MTETINGSVLFLSGAKREWVVWGEVSWASECVKYGHFCDHFSLSFLAHQHVMSPLFITEILSRQLAIPIPIATNGLCQPSAAPGNLTNKSYTVNSWKWERTTANSVNKWNTSSCNPCMITSHHMTMASAVYFSVHWCQALLLCGKYVIFVNVILDLDRWSGI